MMAESKSLVEPTATEKILPGWVSAWFDKYGWRPHPHQLEVIRTRQLGKSLLLVAPTGSGKTLAGFLPSLLALGKAPADGLHTLYVSPLKALAKDIARNLERPVEEMALPIRLAVRSGDTTSAERRQQRKNPPHILMTTPESLELMLAWPEASDLFAGLQVIVLDELHALVGEKRGDLLSLSLARLRRLAPAARFIGLTATVSTPGLLASWLEPDSRRCSIIHAAAGKPPEITILEKPGALPWGGHSAVYAVEDIYALIRKHRHSLVFVNTRAQAEILFQNLWRINEDTLSIGLHHGSLSSEQRQRVEDHMANGNLRAVIATASLDLGIDWAAVDLVIQVGAPKGSARLLQRIGRAGHRHDVASRAVLIPANRFEVLECQAAIADIRAGRLEDPPDHPGSLAVLAQHVVGMAVADPFCADALFEEVCTAWPYRSLSRDNFDRVLEFVSTGGYALRAYERFHHLRPGSDGRWRIASRQVALQWRLNIGTIVETQTVAVRLQGGAVLGRVEEYFITSLVAGDSFIFAGRVLEYIGMKGPMTVLVRPASAAEPKVPAYAGGRLPLSSNLADRVMAMIRDRDSWAMLPEAVRQWLEIQATRSGLPDPESLLVESFPRGGKYFFVVYGFAGRNAHQTLGMLLSRRMERLGYKPVGFVATDYAIAIWSLRQVTAPEQVLTPDLLGDDLEEWMQETTMLKRAFRQVATIAGLIDQRHPGEHKTGRQMTVNADLIYDVLRRHQPDHLLLEATRMEAARGLTDIRRLADMLQRFDGKLAFYQLKQVSPLAVPLMLEVGREQVPSSAIEESLAELEDSLVREVMPAATATLNAAACSGKRKQHDG